MAIALGLLDARESALVLSKKLDGTSDQPLKGHVALALALMDDRSRVEDLRGFVVKRGFEMRMRVHCARALGLLGDTGAIPAMIELQATGETVAEAAAATQGLGWIGDRRALEPLLAALADATKPALARGFAAVALGSICARPGPSWHAELTTGVNYRAKFAALSELLDLL
jgi:HEAT repeat protein